MNDPASSPRRRRGFTLIELMGVIVIIGVLAGLILGISGYANRKAARSKAIGDMEKWRDAMAEVRIKNGKVPQTGVDIGVTDGGFQVTVSNCAPAEVLNDLRYEDPWGRPYQYRSQGDFQFRLWSKGVDNLDDSDDVESSDTAQ